METSEKLKRRKYREVNRVKIAEQTRKWNKTHPEKTAEANRKYREANRERINAAQRKRRAANPEKTSEHARKWNQKRKTSPKRAADHQARKVARRARKRDSAVINCPRVKALYEIARCLRVEGRDVHVDHIYPLALGGSHVFENLQILPAIANLRKGAKYPNDRLHGKDAQRPHARQV